MSNKTVRVVSVLGLLIIPYFANLAYVHAETGWLQFWYGVMLPVATLAMCVFALAHSFHGFPDV